MENSEEIYQVIATPNVTVRPFICMVIVKNLEFSESTYKYFIDMQTGKEIN